MKFITPPRAPLAIAAVCAALLASVAAGPASAGSAAGVTQLDDVTVYGMSETGGLPAALAANSAGYSAQEIEQQINLIDTSDIVKYSPDTMTRKRYIGDRNAIIETRTASVTTSSHSLVYADGVLISNLLGNGYSYPARWNMVMPEELSRVDFFFGPFSAAYAGNSVGTTVLMTTRMPTSLLIAAKAQAFAESFDYLGRADTYRGSSYSGLVGDRTASGISWLLGVDHLDSHGHPMTYAQLGAAVSCTGSCASGSPVVSGGVSYVDPYGATQTLVGAQSIDHTVQDTFKLKLGYELGKTVHARYTLGSWHNRTDNGVSSWLQDAARQTVSYSPTGNINLGGRYYALGTLYAQNHWEQQHWLHALSLTGDRAAGWSWEAVASLYTIAPDRQTSSLPQGTRVGATRYYGQTTRNPYGDGWQVMDLRASWHTNDSAHELSFGAHHDRYLLDSRVDYNTTANDGSWLASTDALQLKAAARGETRVDALYLQDAWRFTDGWRAAAGLRSERWRASGGSNRTLIAGSLASAEYAARTTTRNSPKLALEHDLSGQWSARLAIGRAFRFPTVTELYQAIAGPSTLLVNNPDLRPEDVLTGELTATRSLADGLLRISVFEEDLRDALYTQQTPIPGFGSQSVVSNIDKVRSRGAELAYQQVDVLLHGLDLTGNVTYAQARTLHDAVNPAYDGKIYPGVPRWRATAVTTYRFSDTTALTVAGRYSGDQSNSLANSDVNKTTYTSNSPYFVLDLRIVHDFGHGWKGSLGVDNLLDRTYFAYHPMGQRTVHAEIKYRH